MDTELDFEKHYRLVREIIETIVLTVLMFLIIRLAVQNFTIDGHSMEPTLHNLELILVDKWSYHFHAPTRGDVIVFVAPPNPSEDYIKRVIGLPGDVVTVNNTTVSVNGKQLNEVYVKPQNQGNQYPSFTNMVIPQGAYFVLGDNRAGSSDSRDWGCVPQKNIVGRAALVYWPFGQDNDGLLPNEASIFDGISAPPTPPAAAPKGISNACRIILNPTKPAVGTTSSSTSVDLNLVLLLMMPGAFVAVTRRKK